MLSTLFSKLARHHLFLVVLTFISAIALTSCNPTNLETEAAQVPQVVDSVLSDPKTFNYALSQESPNVASLIYEGLVSENGNGELEPALAESWEISPDKQRIIFTLRDGLKWSDGKPLNVDDVVFTYNDIYLNEKIPTDIRDILRIGKKRTLPSVRKLDERRVEFTIPEPFAPFLRYTGGLAILPAHALRESVTTADSEGKIGGGGVEPNGGANTWSTTGGLHTFNLAPQPGGKPLIGWKPADWEQEIEDLYIKGAGELDETKRRAIYVESQRVTQENLPFIYLVNPLTMETVRDRVGGVKYSALGGAFWNIYELKVTNSP